MNPDLMFAFFATFLAGMIVGVIACAVLMDRTIRW